VGRGSPYSGCQSPAPYPALERAANRAGPRTTWVVRRSANVQEAQSASGPEHKGSGPLTIFFGARQCAEVACVLGPNGRPNAFDASASQDWAGMPIPDERTLPLRSIRNHEPTERPRLGS